MNGNKGVMSSLDSTCSFLSITSAHSSTSVQEIWITNATSSLSLSSDLYVSSFSFNLLPISRITRAFV